MSDLNKETSGILECTAGKKRQGYIETLDVRSSNIGGGLTIRRALPHKQRRMIGPWCFLDHFGPLDLTESEGMQVGPHPHIGLQTVTWLFSGEIFHRDNLGYQQSIRPGQLNLMTAGRGISHSEESPLKAERTENTLHGLQFWIALPAEYKDIEPAFDHYAELPQLHYEQHDITVILGEHDGQSSPAKQYSPAVSLDIRVKGSSEFELPLNSEFEHALLLISGDVAVNGESLLTSKLYYLGTGHNKVSINSKGPVHLALFGGEPFQEQILLWWNFVGRKQEEIEQALHDWQHGDRFGRVKGFNGEPLIAPELKVKLK